MIAVRDELDRQIAAAEPEFLDYLETYRSGSAPLNEMRESGVVSRLVEGETDLRNTAKRLLTGQEYGRGDAMAQVNSVVGRDPGAQRAWRAAVADVLADRVRSTARDDELSIAQVRRVWRDHQDTLAEVFSPEDMATLERTHEMLAPLERLQQSVVTGSGTVDNQRLAGLVEGAVLASTGSAITTGMVMKRIRVMANLIPGVKERSLAYKTQRVVERAMFDPDLARLLLERPVHEGVGGRWNRDLQRVLAAGEASRQMYSEDDEFLGALED